MAFSFSPSYSPTERPGRHPNGTDIPIFPVGTKIAADGDSITQQNHFAASNKIENRASGYLIWALLENPGWVHKVWYDATATDGATPPLFRGANHGIAGDTATGMYNRITPIINTGAKVVVKLCGTNEGATDTLPSAVIASIKNSLNEYADNGIHVILGTIWPRDIRTNPSGNERSPAYMDRIQEINVWIRQEAARNPNVTLWDPWDDMVDPQYVDGVDDEYGSPLAGMMRDGVHPAPLGAYTASKSLSRILRRMMPQQEWFDKNPANSNILSNGNFTGTSGAAQDGVTGTVPDNWAVDNVDGGGSGNVSAVCSLISNAETGGQTLRVVCTSDGLGSSVDNVESILIQPYGSAVVEADLNDGDWVQYFVKITMSANTIVGSFQTWLRNTNTGVFAKGLGSTIQDRTAQPYPTHAMQSVVLQTEALQYNSSDVLNPQIYLDILQTEAGDVTVDIEYAIVRAVEDPQTTFPYTT